MLDFIQIIFPPKDYFSNFTKKENLIFYVSTFFEDKTKQEQVRLIYTFYKRFVNLARNQEESEFNSLVEKFLDCRDKTSLYQFNVLDGMIDDVLIESVIFLEKELKFDESLIADFLNSEGNLLKKTSFFSFEEFDEYFNFSATFVTNMVARILDMNKSQAETFKKLFIAGEVLDFLRKSFLQGYFLNKVIPAEMKNQLGWNFSGEEILSQADTAEKLFDYFWSNYSKSLIVNTQSLKLLSSDNKLMFFSFNHLFLALAQKITTRPNAIFTVEVNLTWQEILPIIYKIDKLV
jgi:phytoene/squalene synthetase